MLYSISIWVLCSLGQQLSKVLKLAPLQPSSFWLLLPVGLYRNVRIIDFESFSRNNKSEEVKLNIYPLSDCQALRRRGRYCVVQHAYTLLCCMRHYDLIHGLDFNSGHDAQESISKSGAKWNQNRKCRLK